MNFEVSETPLTYEELSLKSGISVSTLKKWRARKKNPLVPDIEDGRVIRFFYSSFCEFVQRGRNGEQKRKTKKA